MIINNTKKILIVGLGLLGGSYAMALSRKGYTVTAIDQNPRSIDYALSHNLIARGSSEIDTALLDEADMIVFALYPHTLLQWVTENAHRIKPGTIVTDVTGVKGCIVNQVQSLMPEGVEFIAAHPMAGRELSGVENSDDSIFRGANYIVVPTEKNTFSAIELCKSLGQELGFKDVSLLSPEKHDEMIGFLSQLTHCIAVSLMCACDDPNLEKYTGDSFRDLTRIANINDEMWSELFLANRECLLRQMDSYRSAFDRLYNCVKNADREEMRSMMRFSSERRRNFDKKV